MPSVPLNLAMHYEIPDATTTKTDVTIQDDQGNVLGTAKYLLAKVAKDTGAVIGYATPGGDIFATVEAALADIEEQYRAEFMAAGGGG